MLSQSFVCAGTVDWTRNYLFTQRLRRVVRPDCERAPVKEEKKTILYSFDHTHTQKPAKANIYFLISLIKT